MDVLPVLPWWGYYNFYHCHRGPNDSISPTDFGETPVSVLSRETWNRLAFLCVEGENCFLAEKSVTMLVDRRRRVSVGGFKRHFTLGLLKAQDEFSYAMCD